MIGLTMASSAVEKLEDRIDNIQASKKEQKFLLSEVTGAAVVGFGVGYMSAKNPDLDAGIGPGKRIKLHHVVALGGLYMGRKRGKTAAMARGAGLGATYRLAEDAGRKAGAPSA